MKMTFNQLNLAGPLVLALEKLNYATPTPIQQKSIPSILDGRDLFGCAQTGTGKTAAFALPILQQLYQKPVQGKRAIRALILAPTRELVLQIAASISAYGSGLQLRHASVYGGVSQVNQVRDLQRGVDIVVATPGRLKDLIEQGYIKLNSVEHFVLDEADRMLDMGFINDIKKIIRELPVEKQTLFFSATMPPEISKLANSLLKNPEKVEVTPVSSTAEKVDQSVYLVEKRNKHNLLVHLLGQLDIERTLVFTRTKHGADKIAKDLKKSNIQADAIHGNKTQNARQRALQNFKNGRLKVLVATDIAARGIDVDNLTHVINYDLPNVPETYVHRIGRTGRAGTSGIALSFCDHEEIPYLRDINKLISQVIPENVEHPYKMIVNQQQRTPRPGGPSGPPRFNRNRNNNFRSPGKRVMARN